jgi:hypothetical protein
VEDKKWNQVEEVSSWKDPSSMQMTMVSYFFKLSMVLRNVHTTLTEEYELPYWVSYVAFAVATILLGGILGLILVCCIDLVFPPRREDHQHQQVRSREDKKDSDVEEEDDDIEELDNDSQDEAPSQDEEDSQEGEQSQQSQEEGSPRQSENKTRKRRARKAD